MQVKENEVRLLYISELKSDSVEPPRWTFADFMKPALSSKPGRKPASRDRCQCPWVYSDFLTIDSNAQPLPVWIKDSTTIASWDFYPSLRTLIDGTDRERGQRYILNRRTSEAKRAVDVLLGNGKKRTDPELQLNLPLSARQRLKSEHNIELTSIRLKLDSIELYKFRSGVSVLDLQVRLDPNIPHFHPDVVLEATHALARFNWLYWNGGETSSKSKNAEFRLGDIARSLLDGPDYKASSASRVFTATFMRIADADGRTELDNVAVRAAKHYSPRYDMGAVDEVEATIRRPFQGKVRVTSPEGCAIIIADRDAHDFTQNYRMNTWRMAYAPLAMLALHEQESWSQLVSRMTKWHDFGEGIVDETLFELSKTRIEALQLRTAYSLPRVSHVADHDLWYEDLKNSMRIPDLVTAVSHDLANTEALLREDAERQTAEKYKWLTIFVGASLTGITTLSVVTDMFQVNGSDRWVWGWSSALFTSPGFVMPIITFLIATSVAGYWLWRKLHRKRKNPH